MNIEPFGYFRATPFYWEDCSEDDEGATPLFDKETVDKLLKRIEHLEEALSKHIETRYSP